MATSHICCSLFYRCLPDVLAQRYLEDSEDANGYLVRLDKWSLLVDAMAAETADWARQINLSAALTCDEGAAVSVFLVGEHWAIALAANGKVGPIAIHVPERQDVKDMLPQRLLEVERGLVAMFPDELDAERVDRLFGAMVDGGVTAEEGLLDLAEMLGVPDDWVRWSWFETVPEQLFLDPDLKTRVIPLGEATNFWGD